jgi:glycosyltransferase involved in cell wall biosynthesis
VAGGPANATARLVRGLVQADVQTTVVAPAPSTEPSRTFEIDGAVVHVVAHDQRFLTPRRLRPWRSAALPLVEAAGADVVHGQGVISGGVVVADLPPSTARVVTARGNARQDVLAAYPGIAGRLRAAWGDHEVARVVDAVDVTVNVHPDWRINLPREPHRLVYIPNIVDDVFFTVPRSPVTGRVLFCGGTRRIKGFDVLEAAWPAVQQARSDTSLRVVGWPTDTAPVDLPGAESTGPLDPAGLAEELARTELVVIPSRYEVSPILLAEAWAVGTPVIATDAGGMAALAPGAAVVVPVDAPDALAGAITGALADPSSVGAYVSEGRARADRHRESAVVAAHLSLYRELLS